MCTDLILEIWHADVHRCDAMCAATCIMFTSNCDRVYTHIEYMHTHPHKPHARAYMYHVISACQALSVCHQTKSPYGERPRWRGRIYIKEVVKRNKIPAHAHTHTRWKAAPTTRMQMRTREWLQHEHTHTQSNSCTHIYEHNNDWYYKRIERVLTHPHIHMTSHTTTCQHKYVIYR